jgi:hypothetical protein
MAVVIGDLCVSAVDLSSLFTTGLTLVVVGHSIQSGHGTVMARMTYGTISLLEFVKSAGAEYT